ncbi:MAG: hypothetical protein ACKV22_29240 [Bryobacteraceae bacterium]
MLTTSLCNGQLLASTSTSWPLNETVRTTPARKLRSVVGLSIQV